MGKAPLSRYVYVYIIQVDKIKCMEMNEMIINNRYGYRIPLSPMGVRTVVVPDKSVSWFDTMNVLDTC